MQEFNKGVYDYIIATDESGGTTEADSDSEESNGEEENSDTCMLHIWCGLEMLLMTCSNDAERNR